LNKTADTMSVRELSKKFSGSGGIETPQLRSSSLRSIAENKKDPSRRVKYALSFQDEQIRQQRLSREQDRKSRELSIAQSASYSGCLSKFDQSISQADKQLKNSERRAKQSASTMFSQHKGTGSSLGLLNSSAAIAKRNQELDNAARNEAQQAQQQFRGAGGLTLMESVAAIEQQRKEEDRRARQEIETLQAKYKGCGVLGMNDQVAKLEKERQLRDKNAKADIDNLIAKYKGSDQVSLMDKAAYDDKEQRNQIKLAQAKSAQERSEFRGYLLDSSKSPSKPLLEDPESVASGISQTVEGQISEEHLESEIHHEIEDQLKLEPRTEEKMVEDRTQSEDELIEDAVEDARQESESIEMTAEEAVMEGVSQHLVNEVEEQMDAVSIEITDIDAVEEESLDIPSETIASVELDQTECEDNDINNFSNDKFLDTPSETISFVENEQTEKENTINESSNEESLDTPNETIASVEFEQTECEENQINNVSNDKSLDSPSETIAFEEIEQTEEANAIDQVSDEESVVKSEVEDDDIPDLIEPLESMMKSGMQAQIVQPESMISSGPEVIAA